MLPILQTSDRARSLAGAPWQWAFVLAAPLASVLALIGEGNPLAVFLLLGTLFETGALHLHPKSRQSAKWLWTWAWDLLFWTFIGLLDDSDSWVSPGVWMMGRLLWQEFLLTHIFGRRFNLGYSKGRGLSLAAVWGIGRGNRPRGAPEKESHPGQHEKDVDNEVEQPEPDGNP